MSSEMAADPAPDNKKPRVKSPVELVAGLFLLGLAALGLSGAMDLNIGDLSRMGPGMMPTIASTALAFFGAALIIESLLVDGPALERWNWRGMFFVFGAVLVFAATIRGFGLAVSGPLAVVISSLADRETRFIEIIPFAIVLTIVSAILFKWVLGLPIPLLPFLLDY